jgi:hypothetical protein
VRNLTNVNNVAKDLDVSDKLGAHVRSHNAHETSRLMRCQDDSREQLEGIDWYERVSEGRAIASCKFSPDVLETKAYMVISTTVLVSSGRF